MTTQVVVNYGAVLVAAIANMVLGFLWYGPLFGKKWVALMGWTQEQMEAGKAKMQKEGWKTYGLAFIGSLLMSYVLAHFLVFASAYFGSSGISSGMMAGFWSWLGFVAPVTLGSVLWEGQSWKLWLLLNGYYLAALLIMGSILSLWA